MHIRFYLVLSVCNRNYYMCSSLIVYVDCFLVCFARGSPAVSLDGNRIWVIMGYLFLILCTVCGFVARNSSWLVKRRGLGIFRLCFGFCLGCFALGSFVLLLGLSQRLENWFAFLLGRVHALVLPSSSLDAVVLGTSQEQDLQRVWCTWNISYFVYVYEYPDSQITLLWASLLLPPSRQLWPTKSPPCRSLFCWIGNHFLLTRTCLLNWDHTQLLVYDALSTTQHAALLFASNPSYDCSGTAYKALSKCISLHQLELHLDHAMWGFAISEISVMGWTYRFAVIKTQIDTFGACLQFQCEQNLWIKANAITIAMGTLHCLELQFAVIHLLAFDLFILYLFMIIYSFCFSSLACVEVFWPLSSDASTRLNIRCFDRLLYPFKGPAWGTWPAAALGHWIHFSGCSAILNLTEYICSPLLGLRYCYWYCSFEFDSETGLLTSVVLRHSGSSCIGLGHAHYIMAITGQIMLDLRERNPIPGFPSPALLLRFEVKPRWSWRRQVDWLKYCTRGF